MKAIRLHETGPAENLRYEEVPRPEATAGHALVRVRAAGVCYRDIVDRRGGFPFMKRPVVPGHELSGDIVEVGGDCGDLRAGDRVVNMHRAPCGECEYCVAGQDPRCVRSAMMFGLTIDGGYAEYVLAPAKCLVKIDDAIPFEHACFLACTAGVALRGLRTRGGLRAGETVLVTGASGGVGVHALQIVKLLGARAVAVTSSAQKEAALREHGADEVVVAPGLAFHKEVQARTGGVHLVLDCVGAPTLNSAIRSVRPMGRVVVAGNVTVERHAINPGYLILNEVSLAGTSACSRAELEEVIAWVQEGRLRPVLAEVMPLAEAVAAHKRLEERGVAGRLVLQP
jgi:D-arabinose 1-dehydrogenase-like Zn-dependent alcohol dehydrogenase